MRHACVCAHAVAFARGVAVPSVVILITDSLHRLGARLSLIKVKNCERSKAERTFRALRFFSDAIRATEPHYLSKPTLPPGIFSRRFDRRKALWMLDIATKKKQRKKSPGRNRWLLSKFPCKSKSSLDTFGERLLIYNTLLR